MAKPPNKPKPKLHWSEEILRQRGVRAVVDCMRLNKEHQRLSCENARRVQETRILKEYLSQLRKLNKCLRELVKLRVPHNQNGHSWLNHSHPDSPSGAPPVGN